MSARIQTDIDLSLFKALAKGTERTIAAGTARAVRVALREGAEYARTHHKHTRRTGHLTSADSIRGTITQSNDKGTFGDLTNSASYAAHVEYGTKPHVILPINYSAYGPLTKSESKNFNRNGGSFARHASGSNAGKLVKSPTHGAGRGQFLRFQVGGRWVFARRVDHPGTSPMPFMQPAAEHAGEVIVRETENVTFHLAAALWD